MKKITKLLAVGFVALLALAVMGCSNPSSGGGSGSGGGAGGGSGSGSGNGELSEVTTSDFIGVDLSGDYNAEIVMEITSQNVKTTENAVFEFVGSGNDYEIYYKKDSVSTCSYWMQTYEDLFANYTETQFNLIKDSLASESTKQQVQTAMAGTADVTVSDFSVSRNGTFTFKMKYNEQLKFADLDLTDTTGIKANSSLTKFCFDESTSGATVKIILTKK